MRTSSPLLAPVFRSEAQARLLAALLLTHEELSLTELAERADVSYATAHREAGRLLDAGILTEKAVGRTRLLRANDDSPLVSPLRDILAVAAGPVAALKQQFSRIPGIAHAFVYGSFAARLRGIPGPVPGDVDVMVIGNPDPDVVYAACDHVQGIAKRPVNATILSASEFEADSGFLQHVRSSPAVEIMGELPW